MQKLTNNIWKLNVDSNVYLLKEELTVIDTGFATYKDKVKKGLSEIIDLKKIKSVIFTHLHMDHIGNFDLFPNAKFYASKQEIEDFKKNKVGTILDPELASKFKVTLHPLKDTTNLKIIQTPGHTKGSVCIHYKKDNTLFSGDTLFRDGIGRMDLPTSDPTKMEESLKKIEKLGNIKLAPGHDY